MKSKKLYLLVILDGWGIGDKVSNNAVYLANTPFLDKLKNYYLKSELSCSGISVGLPDGTMGNSEVGHLNIGSGRIVFQDLLRINIAIKDGSFYKNNILQDAFDVVLKKRSSLHLIGLLSDGGVHSHIDHLYALLKFAKKMLIKNIFIHVILDGRDTSPNSGIKYIEKLRKYIYNLKCNAVISTICGRYYFMDRDNHWDRVEKAYLLCTSGYGKMVSDPIRVIKDFYRSGVTDEFMPPIFIGEKKDVDQKIIKESDVVVFFNFRADRARQFASIFLKKDFNHFSRCNFPNVSRFLTMTSYDSSFDFPVIFHSLIVKDFLGEVICKNGLRQLRIAETEKYAHVTYFLNGGVEKLFINEERFLIPSPRDIDTYDKKPQMSAYLIANEVIKCIKFNKYDFIVVNFANMDMVGHTGFIDEAIMACEVVNECVEKIVCTLINSGGVAFITSDHGNVEKMMDVNGDSFTSHTINKVPFIVVTNELDKRLCTIGKLSDIAPTILDLMGICKPMSMTGKSLLIS